MLYTISFLYIVIMCPALTDPENGMITYSTVVSFDFEFMTTATYSCDTGYALVGGDTVRTCAGDREWNGTAPICES